MRAFLVAAGIALLAMSAPAFAQGRGNGNGNGNANGNGQGQGRGQGQGQNQGQAGTQSQGQQNPPPSRSDLPTPAVAQTAAAVTPFGWIDDATLLDPRMVSVAMSIVRWTGSGLSEVDAPVIDVAMGISRRVHLTGTFPRVVGSSDPFGAAGGVGTSYIGAKVAVVDPTKHRVKLSVSPMLEVLGRGVLEGFEAGYSRVHYGMPASAEIDEGPARLYAGTGFFSRGIWFIGGGAGWRATDHVYVSAGYNRAWRTTDSVDVPIAYRVRNEITGSASYAVAPNMSVFGALGRTFKTFDENGAGRTITGGLVFSFSPAVQ